MSDPDTLLRRLSSSEPKPVGGDLSLVHDNLGHGLVDGRVEGHVKGLVEVPSAVVGVDHLQQTVVHLELQADVQPGRRITNTIRDNCIQ